MKAKLLTLKFNPQWILKNQTAGTSRVVSDALKYISAEYKIDSYWIINTSFHQCEVLYVANDLPYEKDIFELLKDKLSNIDDTTQMDVIMTDVNSDDIKKLLKNQETPLSVESIDLLKREFNIEINDIYSDEDKNVKTSENKKPLNDLIGAEPLKQWMDEIQSLKGSYLEFAKQTGVIEDTVFLFSIDRGNGLSKFLKVMAQTLEEIGYGNFGKGEYIKEYKLIYQENQSQFDSYKALAEIIGASPATGSKNPKNENKMILAISLEDWIDKLYDKRLDSLFRQLQTCKNIIYVFNIPYVEGVIASRVYDRLNDIFNVKFIRFTSPTMKEYFLYFKNKMGKYNLSVEDNTYELFVRKIIEEKNDGRFYGYNTVNKIATEVLYDILLKASKTGDDIQTVISKDTFERIYEIEGVDEHSGLEKLKEMVALEGVKKQVMEMISTAKIQKKLYLQNTKNKKPCFHMMFTGNPGTGKTVVARLIGAILKEEGILSVGNFFEVSRQDLVGQYVGQTAPKTMDVCRSAYGSVLFIDEAYLLANDAETYGSEAIGTLISEMENNRDNMVVILAGYKDKMEKLFEINSGLRDRIPYIINFPNYSRLELEDIFYKHIPTNIEYDEEFKNAAHMFFETN